MVADAAFSNSNDDLNKSNDWVYKCKMVFNPGSVKPAHELSLVGKNIHYPFTFKNAPFKHLQSHKHVDTTLKLGFFLTIFSHFFSSKVN